MTFALLRYSLGIDEQFGHCPTAEQWQVLYAEAERQALRGVLYSGVSRLQPPAAPPLPLAMKWARYRETLRGLNELFNSEAARLTALFEAQGHRTAILKGQANARLYPDPMSRQPGDIDIYVDGGRKSVEMMLRKLGLMEGADDEQFHHVCLPKDRVAVPVEVHNMPSFGTANLRTNKRLQAWLNELLEQEPEMQPEGFRTPSLPFALTMQLAHISQHLIGGGVGMRQVVDYYMLLHAATDDERRAVAGKLKSVGLRYVGEALMWVLAETLHLEAEMMLVKPNKWRGEWMMERIVGGGNFGHYGTPKRLGLWQTFFEQRREHWQLFRFNPIEGLSFLRFDLDLVLSILTTIPERMRRGTLRIDGHYKEWYRKRERQRHEQWMEGSTKGNKEM